jgi:hypothetical protein
MTMIRTCSLVFVSALFLAACGSDSGSKSTGGGDGGGSGAGGSGSSARGSCNETKCTADLKYDLYDQAYCDAFKTQACYAEFTAKYDCTLAHDVCKSDNTQDRDVIHANCQTEIDAFDKCAAAQ